MNLSENLLFYMAQLLYVFWTFFRHIPSLYPILDIVALYVFRGDCLERAEGPLQSGANTHAPQDKLEGGGRPPSCESSIIRKREDKLTTNELPYSKRLLRLLPLNEF